jgi:hypothetical protein
VLERRKFKNIWLRLKQMGIDRRNGWWEKGITSEAERPGYRSWPCPSDFLPFTGLLCNKHFPDSNGSQVQISVSHSTRFWLQVLAAFLLTMVGFRPTAYRRTEVSGASDLGPFLLMAEGPGVRNQAALHSHISSLRLCLLMLH